MNGKPFVTATFAARELGVDISRAADQQEPSHRYLCQHPGDCSVRDGVCPHCPVRDADTTGERP